MSEKVVVFNLDDVESINTVEGLATPLFVNEQVSIVHLNLSPQMEAPIHSHKRTGILYVLEGNLILTLKDDHFHLHPGDTAIIQPDVPKGFKNPYSDNAKLLVISIPSGFKNLDGLKEALRAFTRGP